MHEAAGAFPKNIAQILILARANRCFPLSLVEVYFSRSQRNSFLREKQSLRHNFLHLCKIFMEARRNIHRRKFVYTGAAPYRAAQGEIQKKPRGGSRGVRDTQFFRPLVQEEEVSSRARLPVLLLRVNSILLRQPAIG